MIIADYLNLIRIKQWYKNSVVFLPLIFASQDISRGSVYSVFLGFLALSFISSANYIINDYLDRKRDRLHPTKRDRPLAKGRISTLQAILIFLFFAVLAFVMSVPLGLLFQISLCFLFLGTFTYSVWLKRIPFADIIFIAINFVIRVVAGAMIIKVIISPWIILCPFFLALMMASGKRATDRKLLGIKAGNFNPVLKHYSEELTNAFIIISGSALLLCYSLYAFSRTQLMLITIPFTTYAIFRYIYLIKEDSEIARNPELLYRDKPIVIATVFWLVIVIAVIYFLSGKIDWISLL